VEETNERGGGVPNAAVTNLKWHAGSMASCPDALRIFRVTARVANLVHPLGGKTAEKMAAPDQSEKKDLIVCTESPKRVHSPKVRIEA